MLHKDRLRLVFTKYLKPVTDLKGIKESSYRKAKRSRGKQRRDVFEFLTVERTVPKIRPSHSKGKHSKYKSFQVGLLLGD